MSVSDPATQNYFEQLLCQIVHESDSGSNKLKLLYSSCGKFNAQQVSQIMMAFKNAPDRVRAIQVLERRLANMTGCEAKNIIDAFTFMNDKLVALDIIKRALVDAHTYEGRQYILNSFPYEDDKKRAMAILQTVQHNVANIVPAGGHQLYGAIGYTYTQAPPLEPHMYGPVEEQRAKLPGQGQPAIAQHARSTVIPSLYSSHPSYAYPTGRTYMEDRRLPGANGGFPAKYSDIHNSYPEGAPPTCYHGGAPTATGFDPRSADMCAS